MCSCCHVAYYCNRECQRQDNVYHKHEVISEPITTPLNAGSVDTGGSLRTVDNSSSSSSSSKGPLPSRKLVKVRESTLRQIRTMNELARQIRQAVSSSSATTGNEDADVVEQHNRFIHDLTEAKRVQLWEYERTHIKRVSEWAELFDKRFDQDVFVADFYADFMRRKQELTLAYTLAHLTGDASQMRQLHHKRTLLLEHYNEWVFEGWLLKDLVARQPGSGSEVSLLDMYRAVRDDEKQREVQNTVDGLLETVKERIIVDTTAFFKRRQTAPSNVVVTESMQVEDDDDDNNTTTATTTLKRVIDNDEMRLVDEEERRLKRERLRHIAFSGKDDGDGGRAARAERRSTKKTTTKTTTTAKKTKKGTAKKEKEEEDDRVLYSFEQSEAVHGQIERIMTTIIDDAERSHADEPTPSPETAEEQNLEDLTLVRRESHELVEQIFVEVDERMEREEVLTVVDPDDPVAIQLKSRTRLFYETYKAKLQALIDDNNLLRELQARNLWVLPGMLLRGATHLLMVYALMCIFNRVSSNTYPLPGTEILNQAKDTFVANMYGDAQKLVQYTGSIMESIAQLGQLDAKQWAIVQLACLAAPHTCLDTGGRALYNIDESGNKFRILVEHFSTTLRTSIASEELLGNAGNVASLSRAQEACIAYLASALDTPLATLTTLRADVLSGVSQLRTNNYFTPLGLDPLRYANDLGQISGYAQSLWHVVLGYGIQTHQRLGSFNVSIGSAATILTAQIAALPIRDAPFVYSLLNGTVLDYTLRPGAQATVDSLLWYQMPLHNLGIASSFMAQQCEYTSTRIVKQYGLGGWLQALYEDGVNSMSLLNGTQTILLVMMASISLFGYALRALASGLEFGARLGNYLYTSLNAATGPSEKDLAYDAVWDVLHDDQLDPTVKVARATDLLQPYVTGAEGLAEAFAEIQKRETRARPDPRKTGIARAVNALNAVADVTVTAIDRTEASDLLNIVRGALHATNALSLITTFATVILGGLRQVQMWAPLLAQIPFLPSPLALTGLVAASLFYFYGRRILQSLPAVPLLTPALLIYQRLFRVHPVLTGTATVWLLCTLQDMLRTFTEGDVSRVSWVLDALLQPLSALSLVPPSIGGMANVTSSYETGVSAVQTQLAVYYSELPYALDPTVARLVSIYETNPQSALLMISDGRGI